MLKKYLVSAVTVFVLLQPSVASARQWVVLGNNPEISIDVDSIKGGGDTRTFWSNLVYSEERHTNSSSFGLYERKYKSVKTLTFVDCEQKKIGAFRAVRYGSNGDVVNDYDVSYLSVPPNLESPVPDSVGEIELLYVCGLRTANGGRRYAPPSPKTNIRTISYNSSFPRATCGDPFQSSGTYWPVFIDGGDVSRIRANLCNDAFRTIRLDTGSRAVQLASFMSYDRALSFAKQVGGTVGQPTHYVNGRAVN